MNYVSSLAVPRIENTGEAEENEGPSVVTYLVEQGADVNATDHNGLNPVHVCCIRGSIQSARELLLSSQTDHMVKNDTFRTSVESLKVYPGLLKQEHFIV